MVIRGIAGCQIDAGLDYSVVLGVPIIFPVRSRTGQRFVPAALHLEEFTVARKILSRGGKLAHQNVTGGEVVERKFERV